MPHFGASAAAAGIANAAISPSAAKPAVKIDNRLISLVSPVRYAAVAAAA
jgi:hypothetical protein